MEEVDFNKIQQKIDQAKQMVQSEIKQDSVQTQDIIVKETTNVPQEHIPDNSFVQAMTNNDVAIQMARDGYNDIKNQKNIAKGIKKVAIDNTATDIETAQLKVEEKKKDNKVKRQEIKNELFRLKQEKKFLKRESRHKLSMQKFEQRKEKYGDLLLRHCRKKSKNAEGKWEFQLDKNGDAIVNMPNGFVLFWLIVFDSIVMFFNQTADIFSGLNKVVFRAFWILIICLILFVPPIRNGLLGLVGIKFG